MDEVSLRPPRSTVSSASGRDVVACCFGCGRTDKDADPCGAGPMRWAYAPYPDGTTQGNADYYCHRVFQAKYAHQFKRKQFIEKLSSDSAVHDAFFEEVERFISEKKSGKALVRGVATGKTGSEHIVADKTVQQNVIMPQPKFYPKKVYIRKFGADPQKHGHAFTTLHGTIGVLVPADEDEPWTIEPSIATSLTQSKVVDDGEDRVDEGDLEKKFKDIQDMKQAELNIHGKSCPKTMDVEAPLAQEDEPPPPRRPSSPRSRKARGSSAAPLTATRMVAQGCRAASSPCRRLRALRRSARSHRRAQGLVGCPRAPFRTRSRVRQRVFENALRSRSHV